MVADLSVSIEVDVLDVIVGIEGVSVNNCIIWCICY